MKKILAAVLEFLDGFLEKIVAFLYRLLAPVAFKIYLWKHHGKYGERVAEKFGFAPLRDSGKPCLHIHAVSVGEAVAAQSIIDAFLLTHSDWEIFVTVSTATARDAASKRYGPDRVAYYPLDYSAWIERFLQAVRPRIIVLMELEIWPEFLRGAENYRIPVVVANARITETGAAKYQRLNQWGFLRRFMNRAFNSPARWLAQNDEFAKRLQEVGVRPEKIRISGSVKLDLVPTDLHLEIGEKYRDLLGVKSKLLVAGSTHTGEEDAALIAWKHLRGEYPEIKIVLAPRHPSRVDDVVKMAKEYGNVARWSELLKLDSAEANARTEIFVVDTIGELMSFYAAADAVFVGGTLIDHGGQNMVEPCGIAKPTVIGSSYYNFTEAVEALRAVDGILIINSPEKLAAAFKELLDPEAAEFGELARRALLELSGAGQRVVESIDEVIDEKSHGEDA